MNEKTIKDFEQRATRPVKTADGRVLGETVDLEKFAELIVKEYAEKLVQANMSNQAYAQAMDAYYENKWAYRFD